MNQPNYYYIDQNVNLFPIIPPLSLETVAAILLISYNIFILGSLSFLLYLCFQYCYQQLCMITGKNICEEYITQISVFSVRIFMIALVIYIIKKN